MKKVLLVDDKPIVHWLWKLGGSDQFTFLDAYTIEQARELFNANPDIAAVVMDACVGSPMGVSSRIPIREWGFNTRELISELRQRFKGPIIAAPSQCWHFKLMKIAGCNHHCWKWGVARLLRKLLLSAPTAP